MSYVYQGAPYFFIREQGGALNGAGSLSDAISQAKFIIDNGSNAAILSSKKINYVYDQEGLIKTLDKINGKVTLLLGKPNSEPYFTSLIPVNIEYRNDVNLFMEYNEEKLRVVAVMPTLNSCDFKYQTKRILEMEHLVRLSDKLTVSLFSVMEEDTVFDVQTLLPSSLESLTNEFKQFLLNNPKTETVSNSKIISENYVKFENATYEDLASNFGDFKIDPDA